MAGFDFVSIALDARRVTRGTPDLLAARQTARLNALVSFARAHSRFYREKYRGLPDTLHDARQLPPVTKSELMAHFDEVVTDPQVRKVDVQGHIADLVNLGRPFLGQYMVWTTSGTTGTPGIFLEDKHWDAVISAVNVLRIGGEWYGWDVIKGMLRAGGTSASVFAGNGHFLGATMLERQRRSNRSRARRIQLIPVTLPLAEIVRRLNDLQPAMLAGYASALGLLAEEQRQRRLDIHPSIVISSAEPLSTETRASIHDAFGVPPRNNYGCSEGGVMGYECRLGHMHLNADWVLFEPVDASHQPVPSGQLSERTLITNLANRVMPIIRYELGDRVSLSPDRCACGITLPVVTVEGRTDDVLRFHTPGGQGVPILPLALWAVIKETPGVLRFQAIQMAPDRLTIRLEAGPSAEDSATWARVHATVSAYFASQGLAQVTITRDPQAPGRDPTSGKFRNVWRDNGLTAG